jgi:RNA-directed DNA polymerase
VHPPRNRKSETGNLPPKVGAPDLYPNKPETFNFLGFTHICGTNYQTGNFTVRRKTMGKRLAAKLKEIGAQLQRRMHAGLPQTLEWLRQVVRGYFQYHAVPGNWARLRAFRREALYHWYQALRRRSQRSRLRWSIFAERFGALLPPVQILQPYPNVRFDAKHFSIRGKNRVR